MTRDLAKKYTLKELAALTQTELVGDPSHIITGVDSLEKAGSSDASFLANFKYQEAMLQSKAGVICLDRHAEKLPERNYLLSDNPSRSFQKIVELFLVSAYNQSGFTGIHPTAVIHPSAKLGKDVHIGPYVVIDQGAEIGDETKLYAFSYIGSGAVIGSKCILYPHAVVREKCILGNRVILQPGAVIGSCGFGFITNAKGEHTKLDQLGIVEIDDDVEIGANTTIDRARYKTTRIGLGTKVDNLVQIGHNVTVGMHNIIVSQTGVAGSAKTGRNVVLGGQTGVVGHLEIADGVMIAARGGISKSLPKTGKYAGSPVMPLSDYNRQQVHLRKIEQYVKKIEDLEKQMQALEKKFASEKTVG